MLIGKLQGQFTLVGFGDDATRFRRFATDRHSQNPDYPCFGKGVVCVRPLRQGHDLSFRQTVISRHRLLMPIAKILSMLINKRRKATRIGAPDAASDLLKTSSAQMEMPYNLLMKAHNDLSEIKSHALNMRLIPFMANHIGDINSLKDLINAAVEAE